MNGFDLTACLELNLLWFLSCIFSVAASPEGPSVLPDHPHILKSGCKGVFAWLVRNPTKSSSA